ncbi:MAG: hypothetical protein U0169_19880 [Polyangiaceae bacterium]
MTFRVFSQERERNFPAAEVARNAARFFGTRVDVDPTAADGDVDVTVAPEDLPPRSLVLRGREATGDDRFDAERAEAEGDPRTSAGMAALAARCPSVWEFEADTDDVHALALAAVLATVFLGPVLAPDGTVFGVRTARERLASRRASYRSN